MTFADRLAAEEPDPTAEITHDPTAKEIRRLTKLARKHALPGVPATTRVVVLAVSR